MRGNEDRLAQPAQLLEDFHEFDARAGVQPAGGFIEQEQVGIVHEHPREADTLLHPAREPLDQVVLAAGHVGEREHIGNRLVAGRRGQAVGGSEKIEVLENGHAPDRC